MSLVATLKNWVLRGRADEAQVPEVQVLPDGRKRLTRRVKLANHTGAPDWLSVPYGTLDAEAAPAGWENLRLVGKALSDAPTPGGRDTSPMLVLIYETLIAPGETPVGEWKRVRLEDGRDAWSREWLQLLTETATPATVGAVYPATAIVEGVTTYLQREEASPDAELGLRRIVRTVATAGRVMESVESMEYGLRRVTWTCLGAEQTPTGVRVARRVQNVLGFPEFTVTCMQSPSGGSPAGYSFSFNRPVALTYPGRIKAYTTGVSGSSKVLAGAFMSPPVELSVVGTCEVSYSTSPTAYFGTLYSPTMWATVEAKHLSRYGTPVATLEAMRGYIADGGTHQVAVTAPLFMDDVNSGGSIFGKLVYGGSTGYIRVSGGVDPKGSTYTISADNDPVFVDLAGVTYYRHVVVTAAFPSSIPDLPQVL